MAPLRFILGLHLHQPVGNFDHVFQQHVDDVYQPLLDTLERSRLLPAVLHVSGPLLDWLDQHEPAWLDRIARLAQAGQLELLLSGYYEPILASLPRQDRVEQVAWMRDAIRRRFGVEAATLWLTERVWEPELAADLHDAGVQAVLVDDRHFLVAGFDRAALHGWYRTESDGKGVGVFPIDEKLRYLIPFRPPEETAAYLRELHAAGQPLAILADDGEKFGGWPGTKAWVYEKGWFTRFGEAMQELVAAGTVVFSTFRDAQAALPCRGLAYLPTASYREMEGWSLPPVPQRALTRLEHELGEVRLAGPDGGLVRGSHWRNFLVKYAEANRLQKLMCALSRECRAAGDPPAARRAIAKAQCNDAYWHGVFGGLYLPHLRTALWHELATAEAELQAGWRDGETAGRRDGETAGRRDGETAGRRDAGDLEVQSLDLDEDGAPEIWVRGTQVSLVIAPSRGGAIEVLLDLVNGRNLADTLTRRREAYHLTAGRRDGEEQDGETAGRRDGEAAGGTPSIHDIEASMRLDALPPIDPDVRAIGVDRLLPPNASTTALESGTQAAIRSWATERMHATWAVGGTVAIALRAGDGSLEKNIRVSPDGTITWSWRWTPADGWFATELSLAGFATVTPEGDGKVIRYPIETVSKSEKGFDRTVQGESVVILWPARAGAGGVVLGVRANVRPPERPNA